MKKLLCYLLFLIFPLFSIAQAVVNKDFKVTKGTPYEVIDGTKKYYFSKGDEILTVKLNGKLVIIQKMNSKNLVFMKKMEYKDFPSGFDVETVTEFSGRYFVFYSYWQKPNEQLFYREIDFAKGEFVGEGKIIIKTDRKLAGNGSGGGFGFYGISFGVTDKFDFYSSFDKSKLMIQYRLKPEKRDDAVSFDIIGMNVFDNKMLLSWSKEVKMPYTEKKMNNLDYTIDSEGNGYILTTVYEDNTTKIEKKGKPNYHIELLRIKAKTAEIRVTQVKLTDKHINKVWIYENSNDHMICAGYYSKTKDVDDADGVFMFKVDKNGKEYDVISHEIPVSVLNQYATERQQKRNEKRDEDDKADFADLVLKDLIIQDDGSIILIGEQYFTITTTYYTSNGGTRTTTTIYYNDMLITKIDAKGKLVWMQKLGKRQSRTQGGAVYFTKQGGMSYQYMNQNRNHYLLFLDNKKNLELPLNKVPARHIDDQGGFLTTYKINDANGTVSKMSIFDMRDVQGTELYQFMTDRILPLSNNEFVVEVYKKKKEDILIKVTLEK